MTNQIKHRNQNPLPYQAFIVRLWQDGAEALWRGSVQIVQTEEVVRFANLTELFAFLEAQTGDEPQNQPSKSWHK